ncbi:uncharacterized protein PV07_01928 [Cladophialophora immunda]|uniref:Uncharacterized protein n=1 Tax=Cladophialophora immunda TaxID=569365 RepID=A0A0D2A4H3_9EURO|nr:uncharacterized protein PV07_01928 [Cladophialophora immunda]KIW35221.1 hypothetical protein PV07_01928 [Cladophialophora immunda]OQV03885.1 hypothetical protein CLAIMM_08866 [Cladophialophora immunda]
MPRVSSKDGGSPSQIPAPWTTSRCHRTLRQLNRLVARLEKWHKAFLSASEKPPTLEDKKLEAEQPPTWLAQVSKNGRRSQRRYTGRTRTAPRTPLPKRQRKSCSTALTPHSGDIRSIPNIARAAHSPTIQLNGDYHTADIVHESVSETYEGSHRWTAHTVHLAKDYESIIRDARTIIPAFLVATSGPEHDSHGDDLGSEEESDCQGPKSLMHLCLLKLSRTTIEQQKHNDANKNGYDGQQDIMGGQLQELEDYFGDSERGWPQLRVLTRACGISMISRLIEARAIPEQTAKMLLPRSRERLLFSDFVEAVSESLIEASFNSNNSDIDFHDMPGLDLMFPPPDGPVDVSSPWRYNLSIRSMVRALQTRQNPLHLISRHIRWKHLAFFTIVCRECKYDPCSLSCCLLEGVFSRAISYPPISDWHTLRGTNRCSHIEYGSESTPVDDIEMSKSLWKRLKMTFYFMLSLSCGANPGALATLIERISRMAQVQVDLGRAWQLPEFQQLLVAQIFFGELCRLSLAGYEVPDDLLRSFGSLLRTMSSPSTICKELGGTIIALCRAWSDVERLVVRLLSIKCGEWQQLSALLAQLAANGAMEYAAEHLEEPSILSWASDFHETAGKHIKNIMVEHENPFDVGYRWDETVEEWVAKTPATRPNTEKSFQEIIAGDPRRDENGSIAEQIPGRRVLHQHSPTCSPSAINGRRRTGNKLKRRHLSDDVEVHMDGDFEYKKVRRGILPQRASRSSPTETAGDHMPRMHGRQHQHLEEESEAELSLLQ